LRCVRCQSDNRDGVKFCEECGGRLTLNCASCGAELLPDKRFCGSCGTPVSPQGTERFASPQGYTPKHLAEKILTSKGVLEGERKQVTILFADLKGSMELLADRDPEEARKLLDPVLERMMEAVHRYEGTVNQVMGDGIMALFGAPLAHEDHAVRACRAAIRMQETVGWYAEELRRGQGIDVQIRVGLNSGEVVVRAIDSDLHMDYSAIGQTTHLAARMEQLARPGTTLITGDTLRLAEGYVEVKPLGPVPVKGMPTPVEVFEIVRFAPLRSRLQAEAARGLTPFVGREVEVEKLRYALEKAGQAQGQLVAVAGDPGVGKSRLFWEFTHSHRAHGWLILECAAMSHGKAISYLPVSDVLRTYFRIDERDSERRIREKVTGKLLTLDEGLRSTLPAFFQLLDLPAEDMEWQNQDPSQRRQRTLDAVKRLLLRESREQPLLLIFENLHWIDSETQAFLDSLVDSLPAARVLVLVSYRPEYQHGWGSKTYYTQFRMDPLPASSAEELLHALLGDDPGLEPLKTLLIKRTEGNPFFLEESVRTLVETGVLRGTRRFYRLARPLASIQVPPTVQAILASRIDRLAPEDKELLQAASVIGKDVPYPLLAELADQPEARLSVMLSHLQTAEFLYEVGSHPDLTFTFRHALTHEVAYTGLLHERRRALHARAMEALEHLDADRLSSQRHRLAHHAFRGEVWDKALAYCQDAAARDFARSAHAEALDHVDQALHALRRVGEPARNTLTELLLVAQRAAALRSLRGYASPEVEDVYRQARELCRAVGDTPERFGVEWQQMQFFLVRGDLDATAELSAHLLQQAERGRDRAQLMDAHLASGMALFHQGLFAAARDHLEQGVALYRPGEDKPHLVTHGQDPGVFCLSYLAYTLWFLGYPDQAIARAEMALDVARQSAHAFSHVSALTFVARVSQCRRDLARTRDVAHEILAAAREHGFAYYEAQGRIQLGWTRAMLDGDDAGCTQILEGYRALEQTGTVLGLRGAIVQLCEAYRRVGRAKEAAEALDMAHDPSRRRETLCWDAEFERLRAELAAEETDGGATAVRWYEQALATARRQGARALELRAALGYAKMLCVAGRGAEARRVLRPIVDAFTEGEDTVELRDARALLSAGS
jgi:class 3 adenylate cyclase/tetratricopeptide (TPR) repeat protein